MLRLTRLLRLLLRLLRPLSLSAARRVIKRNGYVAVWERSWHESKDLLADLKEEVRENQKEKREWGNKYLLECGVSEGLRKDLEAANQRTREWEQEFHRIRGEKAEMEKVLRERVEAAEKLADGFSRAFLKTSIFGHTDVPVIPQPEVKPHIGAYRTMKSRTERLKAKFFEAAMNNAKEQASYEPNDSTDA